MGSVRRALLNSACTAPQHCPLGNQMGVVRIGLLYSSRTATNKKTSDLIDLIKHFALGLVWALYVQRPCRALVQRLYHKCNPKCLSHGILILGCNQQKTCKKRYKYIMNKHTMKNTQYTQYKGMHEKCVCATKSLHCNLSTRNLPLECLTLARS